MKTKKLNLTELQKIEGGVSEDVCRYMFLRILQCIELGQMDEAQIISNHYVINCLL